MQNQAHQCRLLLNKFKENFFHICKQRQINKNDQINLLFTHRKTLMSEETLTPVHNDVRYEVTLRYFKQKSYIIYEMIVRDLGMGKIDRLIFRFSQICKFHQRLIKMQKIKEERIPEFPQKNSLFVFWNKTNNSVKKIQERRRELQYYFTKLLNDPILRGLNQVKQLLRTALKQRRRTKSLESYKYDRMFDTKPKSLPKTSHSFTSRSNI